MMRVATAIIGALSLLWVVTAWGQERDHYGTEFVFPPPTGAFEPQELFIVSPDGATGTVTNPAIGLTQQFVIPPNGSVSIDTVGLRNLPAAATNNNSFRIVADSEVAVFWSNHRTFDHESYIMYPVDTAGTEYLLSSYFWSQDAAGGRFNVTAIYDGTVLSITPTENLRTTVSNSVYRIPGETFTISLNAGETYNLIQATDLVFDPDRFAPRPLF